MKPGDETSRGLYNQKKAAGTHTLKSYMVKPLYIVKLLIQVTTFSKLYSPTFGRWIAGLLLGMLAFVFLRSSYAACSVASRASSPRAPCVRGPRERAGCLYSEGGGGHAVHFIVAIRRAGAAEWRSHGSRAGGA